MWKYLNTVETPPVRLDDDDKARCLYARDYASQKRYDYSEANKLISNLKKDISRRGERDWIWKQRAIEQFATELAMVFPENGEISVAPIPSSKHRDDENYDSMIDDVLSHLSQLRPNVSVICPVIRKSSIRSAHTSKGNRPSMDEAYQSMAWTGDAGSNVSIVLVDDVITAGTTFKTCQRIIRENRPDLYVFGVFWARTVWPDTVDIDLSGILNSF
jgi:hypothetical protein